MIVHKRHLLLLVITCFGAQLSDAANLVDTNLHAWSSYFGDHPLSDSRWGLHLEAQVRRHNGFDQWQQLLLRPGVNFQINKNVMWSEGYAFVLSSPYGDHPAVVKRLAEHRLWHQAQIKYKTGAVLWSNRLRFENRFIGTADSKFRYENRFRIWQRGVIPLSKTYFIAAYDELWFYVKPSLSKSAIDQNRAYVALGRRFGQNMEMEAGYMNQTVWQRNGTVRENNHTLMLSLFNRKPLRALSR